MTNATDRERQGARVEGAEEHPRCEVGSGLPGRRCWRKATERAWELAPEPLQVCAEHKRVIELGQEADTHLIALDNIQEWIGSTFGRESGPDLGTLERHAHTMRSKAQREYWPVAIAYKAAEILARQPEGEKPLSQPPSGALAPSQCLIDAAAILEDTTAEEMLMGRNRWLITAVLVQAADEASQAHRQYNRELGLTFADALED